MFGRCYGVSLAAISAVLAGSCATSPQSAQWDNIPSGEYQEPDVVVTGKRLVRDPIMSMDFERTRPGACATLATRSPRFQEFLRLNPAVRSLSLDDQQGAYALAGASVVVNRLKALSDPASGIGLSIMAGQQLDLDSLLEGIDEWRQEMEDRWVYQADGSDIGPPPPPPPIPPPPPPPPMTPRAQGPTSNAEYDDPQRALAPSTNAEDTRLAIMRSGLVSPARVEIEVLLDIGLAQYFLWAGEHGLAAERAGLARDRLVRDLPSSPLVLAANLTLIDAHQSAQEGALALQYAELFDEDLRRFPQLSEPMRAVELKTSALKAAGYASLSTTGLAAKPGRNAAEEAARMRDLYRGGGNLLQLFIPGGAGLLTLEPAPTPEGVLRLYAPGTGASFVLAGQTTLLALTQTSDSAIRVSPGRPASLAEQARWTIECGQLSARAALAGDLQLAAAAGNTAFGQLDGPMAKALVNLGIQKGEDGYWELRDEAADWFTSQPGKSEIDFQIALVGVSAGLLPVLSGDRDALTGALQRTLSDDVLRYGWREARSLIEPESIAEQGLTMRGVDQTAERAIRVVGGVRDLFVAAPLLGEDAGPDTYRAIDRLRSDSSGLISAFFDLAQANLKFQIGETDWEEDRERLAAGSREMPALRSLTTQYVQNIFTNLEAMVAHNARDDRRFSTAVQASQRQARLLAAAFGGRVTASDPVGIIKQSMSSGINYGLAFSDRFNGDVNRSGQGLTPEQREWVELGIETALDVLLPSPPEGSQAARERAQRYRTAITRLQASAGPNWQADLRESLENANWSETSALEQQQIAGAANLYGRFLFQGAQILNSLREIGAEPERAFVLDGVQTLLQAAQGQIGRGIERSLANIDDDLYLLLVQVGFDSNRLEITESAVALWDAAKRMSASRRTGRNAQSNTQDFRADRTAFGIQAWVMAQRLLNGRTDARFQDGLIASLEFANRSAAGVDFSLQLEMQSAPEAVRNAYERWRQISLGREADANARLASARESFKVGEVVLASTGIASPGSAFDESQAYRELQIAAEGTGYQLQQFRPPSMAGIQAALDDREVLISGFAFNQELLVVAIKRGQPIRVARVQRPYSDLKGFADQLRTSLTLPSGGSAPSFNSQASRELYASLFAFADDFIDASDRVVWTPPRGLDNFPIAALDRSRVSDFRWLGIEKEIMVAPSLASLVSQRSAAPLVRSGAVAAIGDIPFAGVATGGLGAPSSRPAAPVRARISNLNSYLGATPAARGALNGLAQLFPQTVLIAGANATKANVTAGLQDRTFDYLLFHTHGVGEDVTVGCGYGVPQALALNQSDPSQSCASALLGAQDAAQLRVKARVVMLGACSTSAAPNQALDPLSGMARGFLLGGARAVVSAHLPVSENAAAIVGRDLATGLLTQNLSPSAALRQAMANVRAQPGMSSPAYWAQFELIGEGGR